MESQVLSIIYTFWTQMDLFVASDAIFISPSLILYGSAH